MKYTKPDYRIAPLWQSSSAGLYIFRVQLDGRVQAVLGSDGSRVNECQAWQEPGGKEWVPVVPYGQTPPDPPLVIEPGKWYETRGGDKAFVGCCNPDCKGCPFMGFIAGEAAMLSWKSDGVWHASGALGNKDLIRETEAP